MNGKERNGPRSSLTREELQNENRPRVLLVIGDGAEVLDTMYPFYRLAEDYRVVVAGPQKDTYHLVTHELVPGWDITREGPGYHLEADIAFRDVDPNDYVGMILPGGRAPEYLRYDADLLRLVKAFVVSEKPVASICHGIEILGAADVIRGKEVTTIPKCRLDAEACGAIYVDNPVVRSGNLICAQGKKDMSSWMQEFARMISDYPARADRGR
ncbi:MAG: DJ-1/PfpI family protein [Phycisphaerales bacterium]|nr:MAG: DJ-1/PfpI family protein [Phycisphaerales bacterium]